MLYSSTSKHTLLFLSIYRVFIVEFCSVLRAVGIS